MAENSFIQNLEGVSKTTEHLRKGNFTGEFRKQLEGAVDTLIDGTGFKSATYDKTVGGRTVEGELTFSSDRNTFEVGVFRPGVSGYYSDIKENFRKATGLSLEGGGGADTGGSERVWTAIIPKEQLKSVLSVGSPSNNKNQNTEYSNNTMTTHSDASAGMLDQAMTFVQQNKMLVAAGAGLVLLMSE